MNDKRNHHGAVGKLSSEQQFYKSDVITFSATGSYGRLAGSQNLGDFQT